jgi:FkbM family methyltransferase
MRSLIQKIILKIFALFPLDAYRFASFISNNKLSIALMTLHQNGLNIRTVYDIGANNGNWSKHLKKDALRQSQFVLFEANESHVNSLEKTGLKYFVGVLSSKENIVDFFSVGGAGDSYFLESTVHYSSVSPKKVLTQTLDKLAKENSLPKPDLIKLDTQGSEIDILKGGMNALESASLVLIECPIVKYNIGAPNIHEYIVFLQSCGFVPIDLMETHFVGKIVAQIDLLFMREDVFKRMYGESVVRIAK